MAEEMRLDLEELKRLESIAKRPRVLSLLSFEIRDLDSKLSKEAVPIAQPMAFAEKSAGPSYVTLDKFSWDQDNEKIKVYVFLEGVVQEKIETIFKPMSVDIKFHDVQGKNYRCAIPKLNKEIVPEKCKILVKPTKVIIVLSKASKGNWLDLHFKEDKDAENNQSSSNQSDQSIKDMLLVIQQNVEKQCRQTSSLQKDVETLQSTVMTAVEHVRGPTAEHVGTMSDFIHLSPPVFTGTEGPFAADEWIVTVEMLLEAIKVPKEEMVSMARIQLRDVAYHWWSVEKEEFKEGVSWDVFKERFLDQFFPKTYRDELEDKFIHLKQEGRTVEEYSTEFIRLSKFAPLVVTTEAKRVKRFQQGLDAEFQMPMLSCRCTTFSSVVDAAKHYELLKSPIRNEQGDDNRPFEPLSKENGLGMAKRQRLLVTCRFCGKNGHLQRDCWRANGLCLHCGAEDHQVIQCPHAPISVKVSFAEAKHR